MTILSQIIGGTSGSTGKDVRDTLNAVIATVSSVSPAFVQAPSISPAAGNTSTTFTANDGNISGGLISGRRWLLGGTSIGSGTTIVTGAAGNLVLEVTAVNPLGGKSTVITTVAIAVSAQSVAPLTYPSATSNSDATNYTATSGTYPAGTSVAGKWYRDGAAMSPAVTSLNYPIVASTDNGSYLQYGETVGNATYYSNALLNLPASNTYYTTFAGTDGTLLNGYDRFYSFGTSDTALQISGNDIIQTKAGSGVKYLRPVDGPDFTVTTRLGYPATGADNNNTIRYVYARFTDDNNYVLLRTQGNGYALQVRAGGTTTNLVNFASRTIADNTAVGLRVIGDFARVYFDGVEASETASASGGQGLSLTQGGTIAAPPKALTAGFQGAGTVGSATYPFPAYRDYAVTNIPANATVIGSVVSATDSLSTSSQIAATVQGTIAGSITQLQYAIFGADGSVAMPWANTSGASGQSFTFTTDLLPAKYNGTNVTVAVRDAANHSTMTTAAFVVPARQTIFPLRMGQQDGQYAYYSNADYARDHGRRMNIRIGTGYDNAQLTPGGIGGYDTNGYVNSYVSGTSAYRYVLQRYWANLGTYTIAYPAGMSCAPDLFPAGSYNLGAEYAINSTTSGRKLTVNVRNTGDGYLIFSGVPTGRTATSLGLRPSITLDTDANPSGLAADEMAASYVALNAKIFRSMDARRVNDDLGVRATANINTYFDMALPMMVANCNKAGSDLWLNMYLLETDAAVRTEFDYVAANLDTSRNCYLELANENWNSQFAQTEEATMQGIAAGYCVATSSASATPITFSRMDGNFTEYKTRTPLRAFAVGDVVAGTKFNSGILVWKALQAITANDTNANLPASTNAYWQVLYSNTDTVNARLRWCSKRTAEMTAIAKAAFSAVGRNTATLIPVFAHQAVASFSNVQPAFDFDDNYKVFKRYATGPYWGEGVGGVTMSYYNGNDFGTWTATEKALYLTDTAACVNAFFANANTAIDAAVNAQRTRKNELAAYLASKSWPIDSCQMAAYEFNSHARLNGDTGWSDGTKAAALRDAIFNDPRSATAIARYLTRYRSLVGGDACWYGRMGLPAPWNTQLDELDRNSNMMSALVANS